MNITDRLRYAWRAFKLGPAVVNEFERAFGKDPSEFSPEEYGQYIATSNAVYSCVKRRAQYLAMLQPMVYRADRRGNLTELQSHPLLALLNKPNPWWTFNRLIQMTEMALCLWGVAYWFLERNGGGPVREIYWGRPDRVRVVPHPTEYVEKFLYQPATAASALSYDRTEVVWIRNANPIDEYQGLAALAAARLSADVNSAALKSNKAIFDNGLQIGGVITPKGNVEWTEDQAKAVEDLLALRFKGVDKRHRWAVFRQEAQMQNAPVTPADVEFLGTLNWTLEDVARAFQWPLDLLGGQRTYANVESAMKAAWTDCVLPEAAFISDELTMQLLPTFGEHLLFKFDSSKIEVLQEDRAEIVQQLQTLAGIGVPLNRLLQEFLPKLLPETGDGYEWGDVWWAPISLMPADKKQEELDNPAPVAALPPAPSAAGQPQAAQEEEAQRAAPVAQQRVVAGSDEHKRLWQRFIRRTSRYEERITATVQKLFERQRDSILDKLKARGARLSLGELLNLALWEREFGDAILPILLYIISDVGNAALEDLGLAMSFDVATPLVQEFLRARAQRFAQEVNSTTWNLLQDALATAQGEGKGIPELSRIVEDIMGDRIRSTPETIARTEAIGAANGGTLLAWEGSGVVQEKEWLAALDERTRDTHIAAHGQVVPIHGNFQVGAGHGPAPGQIGLAEEDINCRCTMLARLGV